VYFPGSDAVLAGASDRVDERLSFEFFIRPSQIGPRSPLPCVQGTHERNGGKPEYYDALHLSGDPTQEYQLRAARPRHPSWS